MLQQQWDIIPHGSRSRTAAAEEEEDVATNQIKSHDALRHY